MFISLSSYDIGDVVFDTSDKMKIEIIKKHKTGSVTFKILENPNQCFDMKVGKSYNDKCGLYESTTWELVEESHKNISPASIKELEKNIQKEETNLNQFVETTRKNISEMKQNLEKLKKTANKIPTIVIGEMYSYTNSIGQEIVGVCVEISSLDNSRKMAYFIDQDFDTDIDSEWIYDDEFGDSITNFKHLNSPAQKKIAAGFYAMFTGDIPGV